MSGQDIPTVGQGQLSPTVSEPGIHYTTTVETRAFVHADTCIFIAYDHTFLKRVLHPLKLTDATSFSTPRPLFLEDSLTSSATTSILDIMTEKFAKEDQVSVHILHPRQDWSNGPQLEAFQAALKELTSKLPYTPIVVTFAWMPSPKEDWPTGVPRILSVTGHPFDKNKSRPVSLANEFLRLKNA